MIDLEFTESSIRRGWLPDSVPLTVFIDVFDTGAIPSFPLPFPEGLTGDLWNLFIDDDLRVAFGTDDDPSTNDGTRIEGSLTLSPEDALFLVRESPPTEAP